MRPNRRDLVLVLFAVALSGCTLLWEVAPHDEGLMLAAAERIADGEMPYRDFWWNYGPGQAYLLGALSALTGPSLLAWRIVRVAVDATVAVLVARTVADRAGPAPGRWPLASGLAAAAVMAWPTGPGPWPPALALALAGFLVADRRPREAGALAGLAAIMRPDLGVLAAAGMLIDRPRRSLGSAFAVVVAVGYAPFVLLAGGELVDQTVGFAGIQDLQRLPFPLPLGEAWPDPNKLLEAAFPALLVAGTAGVGLWLGLRRGRVPGGAWAFLPLAVGGLAYLLARTDEFHAGPLALMLVVLAGIAGARDRAAAVRVGACALLAVIALHGVERQVGRLLHPGDLVALPGPSADGVRADRAFADGVRLVASATAGVPGPVLVAPSRFDQVRFGAPLLYVLLRRSNPSRYDVIQPGVVTTEEVQREIAADLRRTRTPWVVRWVAPQARVREPNGSGRSSGVRLLDAVIARDYREVARDGSFVVLARRER